MKRLLFAILLSLFPVCSFAAVATFYVDTGGCESGSTTLCSGTTDSASASAKGTGSTITCSATSGPAAAPGCIITGTETAVGQIAAIAVDGSQALFVNCATNSGQKTFFINAVDNATGAVGTTVTPTGCTAATSNWGIGGRIIWTPGNLQGGLRGGDTVQFNDSPATRTSTYFTASTSGDETNGAIRIIGKAGVRPLLHITSGNVAGITLGSTNAWYIENLEIKTDGATSAAGISTSGAGTTIYNVKISATGGGPCISFATGSSSTVLFFSELTGCGDGVNGTGGFIFGNYIHNVTGDCIEVTGANPSLSSYFNVLANCGGRGLFVSGSITTFQQYTAIINNTIYGNTLAGIEITDAGARVGMINNIVMNTNSANIVKWTASNAQALSSHNNNLFYSSSSGTLSGLTTNSTELTSDPLFTNAGSGDFTLQTSSPAKATGFPGVLLGSNTGYIDMGALQHQDSGGGSTVRSIICGMNNTVQVALLCPK